MIFTHLLWKVKGCHYFIEALLIIVLRTKYDLNHYSIKRYFSNHKKKKSKERFPDYAFLFYFYSRQVIEEMLGIYSGNNFCLQDKGNK